ncbi:unnamed protein product [Mytilus edulis]|uniref:Uncharacterized protein n=1 Tax=Mytilus edulis TaxID=6550 RepID=A0A8S3SBY2_MYTED|nr:unnamed protein product [Mytilus edulis]
MYQARNGGDFLLHYAGETISAEEGERREADGPTGFRFFIILERRNCDIHFGEEILYDYGVNVVFEKVEKGDTVVGPEGARGIVGPQGENGVAGPVEPMEPSGPPGIPGPGGLTTDGIPDLSGTPDTPGVFAGHLSEMIGKPGKDGDPGLQGEPGLPVSKRNNFTV